MSNNDKLKCQSGFSLNCKKTKNLPKAKLSNGRKVVFLHYMSQGRAAPFDFSSVLHLSLLFLLFPFVCFLPFSLFHSFSLFLLAVKQEKDVHYRLGSTGPQLPNNTLIYQPPPASLHEEAVLLCWLLLTARKAGCLYFWLHVLRMCLG